MNTEPRLQLGVNMPTWPDDRGRYARWNGMRDLAVMVEQADLDTLWVPDHLLRHLADGSQIGFWECWTILSAVAAVTGRVTIGPFVACAGFHNPAHLAKSAATLDEVSGGRVILTVGAGVPDRDRSWQAFGFPDDHPAARFDEALQIIRRLLHGESLTYQGRFFKTDNCEILLTGQREGKIPLWAAGKGPATMRSAARWADDLNLNMMVSGPDDLQAPFEILEEACREVGRDPATLGRTGYAMLDFADRNGEIPPARRAAIRGSTTEIAGQLQALHDAGLRHLTLYIDTGEGPGTAPFPALTPRALELLAPVIEELRKLEGLEIRADPPS